MSNLESFFASMTLAQLGRIANTTVDAIVARAFGGTPHDAKPTGSAAPRNGKSDRAPARGRGEITDDAIIEVLRGAAGPVGSEYVRGKVGGSAAQVRAALQRLRDAKRVRVEGKKRGTRYSLR